MFDELEEYEEAIAYLSNYLNSDSTNSAALNNRGVANREIGNIEEALRDFENAILADPDIATPYINIGDVLKIQNEYQRAIESYSRAIELDEDKSYRLCRAYTYVEMKLFQEAIEDFSFVLNLDPKHSPTYTARARAFEAIGDKVRAASDFANVRE